MTHTDHRFSLTKWYLDCTAKDGRSAIAYWIGLSWRGLDVVWHGIDVYGPNGEHHDRWSAKRVAPPTAIDGCLEWRAPAVGAALRIETRHSAFFTPLLSESPSSAASELDWHCVVPGGPAAIELAGHRPLEGAGYAECLTLKRPPWLLPIAELRWGRWMRAEGERSLVWIDWQGPTPRCWVFLDGRAVPDASVSDDGVRSNGFDLALAREHTLVHRDLAERLSTIPGLSALVPESFRALRDTKWRGTGTLTEADCEPVAGAALFEAVRLR